MSNQAYIFDMDGVLADNCRYHVLAWRVFSKKHGFELTDEQVLEWMGAANRVYMERLLGRPVSDNELAALENEKESLYRELYAPHRRIPDGLRAFLDRAHAADIPCGVATGAPEQNITFILDGLDLRRDFRCVVDPTQYSHSKPAPDCYLRAAALLGADTDSTGYVSEEGRQPRQQGNIRHGGSRFPFADCLERDAQVCGQFLLGDRVFSPQTSDDVSHI